MQTTFTHRLIFVIVAAFALALLIEFYRNVIADSQKAMSTGYIEKGKSKPQGAARR